MTLATTVGKAALSVGMKKLLSKLPSARTTDLFNKMAQDAAFQTEGYLLKMIERLGGDPDAALERLAAR